MSRLLPAIMYALIGLAGGALVNYLADVLPIRRKIVQPFCLNCQQLFPIANYLFWPQRCEFCGKRRQLRVWVVYLVYILAGLWLSNSTTLAPGRLAGWALLVYFGVVTVIDIEHRLILHPVSLVGACLALFVGISLHGVWRTLAGGAVGFAAMLLLYGFGLLYGYFVARRRGEQQFEDALGFGDVNLSGVVGLLLGWPGVIAGIILAILLAGTISLLYVVLMLLRKRYHSSLAIPYGPFLVASALILLFFRGNMLALLQP